ncbi:metal-dependent hydrolase [Haloferula sp. BvORR071]|uniref:metal-dependent hydrolase n=1 Tax=Haloferula sp. BvORR071 TaxID=1396141 RepID=UPI00094678C2|nr:metal-dependent hydrolase [Haloferula sp. BvORR071]
MLLGTHILLPVCGGLALDNASLRQGRGYFLPLWSLAVIGLFGALPDLCCPHLELDARYTSWSHTVWFMAGLIPVCAMVASFFPKQGRWWVALFCWLAAALHLAGDAVAGGIAWLYPWRSDVIGKYYIPAGLWWFVSDIIFVLLTWFLIRLRPHSEARGIKA